MLLLVTSVGPSLYYGTYALAGILTATLIAGLVGAPAAPLTAVLSWAAHWRGLAGSRTASISSMCRSIACRLSLHRSCHRSWALRWSLAAALACTFALAAASFYLVERRFLDLKDRIAARGSPQCRSLFRLLSSLDLASRYGPDEPVRWRAA
jgi:peptidoglycan/LPS O-acetylase OafA/YrhL